MNLAFVIPLLFLIVGCADDLIYKKFHNFIFVIFFLVALVLNIFIFKKVYSELLISLACCSALFIPAVFMNIFGAGDYKLALCISCFLNPKMTINFFIFSIIWGLIIGLIKVFSEIATGKNKKSWLAILKNSKIPFTIALLLGFLTVQNGSVIL